MTDVWAEDPVAKSPEHLEFFESKIRPVLVEHCYQCHSADSEKLKGGLFLDSRDGMMRGGDSGPTLVPGDPEDSILVKSLRYDSEFPEMPPKERLSEDVIHDFEKWIKMGAPDPRHENTAPLPEAEGIDIEAGRQFWAFQAPQPHAAPAVKDASWPRGDMDRFILAKLEEKTFHPAPDADAAVLARRLYFDLVGLPPSPEQLSQFISDYEADPERTLAATADRLLALPQFGEKWGRHWLDLARYADSNGGDINLTYHNAWRYRQYVVDAFNADKPYDQFIREQIAGDLLPYDNPDQRAEQLIGSGFLVMGPKMLSERDKEKMHLDIADEQIDTVGRVFMGMTLGCARCHDHKFDPIPARDYYALAGIFRSTYTAHGIRMGNVNVSGWIERELPMSPELEAKLVAYQEEKQDLEKQIASLTKEVEALKREAGLEEAALLGVVVDDKDAEVVGDWTSSTHSPNFYGEGYLHDNKADKGKKSVTWRPSLPGSGEYEVRISYAASSGRDEAVPVTVVHAGGEETLIVNQSTQPPIAGMWDVLGRFHFEGGKSGFVQMKTEGTRGYIIADAVQFIPVADLEKEKQDSPFGKARALYAEASGKLKSLEGDLKALEKQAPEVPMAMAAQDREKTGDVNIRIRGEVRNLGPVAERGFLQVASLPGEHLPKIGENESGRLELAGWLASPANPLTARVMVNRVWHHLHGSGLVRTVDNFGELGDRPSHPELLDQLAVQFIESGWSVKSLVREIVLSRAYRQSADPDPATEILAAQADPENRLLWKQNRRRLSAEAIRDALLAVSGQLDPETDQSPVDDLGEQAIANSANQSGGLTLDGLRKRSLYMPMVRNDMPPFLETFDMANPDMVTGNRQATTVPTQALLMLNSELVGSLSRDLAGQLRMAEPDDPESQVRDLYLRAFSREPSAYEIDRALTFVREMANDEGQSPEEALASLAHMLFASTEFRYLN